MQVERSTHRAVRGAAAATALAVAVGLAGGAVTIVTEYRHFLTDRTTKGPYATVDWYLQSAGMGTSEEFLSGIARAQLPRDADVAFVAPVSGSSGPIFWQTYYVASYLLTPRAVSAIAWCDAPAAAATSESTPAARVGVEPHAKRETSRGAAARGAGAPRTLIDAQRQNCEPFPAVTDLGATVAARGARHVLVAGNPDVPLDPVRAHRISSRLTLLDLQ